MNRLRTHEIRVGQIVATIRSIRKGTEIQHVVSVCRLVRNDDRWVESTRFNAEDIPVMRHVLDEAHNWIINQPKETSRSRKTNNGQR